MRDFLDFEKPLIEFEERIEKLKPFSKTDPLVQREIETIEKKAREVQTEIYARLTPWQRTQLARHQNRPNTLDYIAFMIHDFVELHGDRLYGDGDFREYPSIYSEEGLVG